MRPRHLLPIANPEYQDFRFGTAARVSRPCRAEDAKFRRLGLLVGSAGLHLLFGLAVWHALPRHLREPDDTAIQLVFAPARIPQAALAPQAEMEDLGSGRLDRVPADPPALRMPPPMRDIRPRLAPRRAGIVPPAARAAAPVSLAPKPPEVTPVDPGWRIEAANWLQSHRVYPEAARRHGDQGTAIVRATVSREGAIVRFLLVHDTGSPRLDEAVAMMMDRAHLPPFPPSMVQDQATITMTVNFILES